MSGQFGAWEDAARHPLRTLTLAFVLVAVATGVGSYYDGATPRSPWVSAAIGICCGVVVTVFSWKRIVAERDGRSPEIDIRPVSVFSVLVASTGLAISFWGVATADWGLAAAGLPLAELGLGLIAVRWWFRARGRPTDPLA